MDAESDPVIFMVSDDEEFENTLLAKFHGVEDVPSPSVDAPESK